MNFTLSKKGFTVIRYLQTLLSCQPRVTVTSCFAYKVIRDLLSMAHLCINPILRMGLIHKCSFDLGNSSEVYTLLSYLENVNKVLRHFHSWLARQ